MCEKAERTGRGESRMRYEKKSSWAKHFDFILLDLICAEIVIFLCYAFRNGLEGTIVSKNYGRLALLVGVHALDRKSVV